MAGARSRGLAKWIAAAVRDDNLDLYVLASVAVVFTVLGATGISDVKTLSSVVLGLLAMLAFSQIKSRKLTSRISEEQSGSTARLRRDFPADLIPRRASASDILLVGLTMTRTIQGLRSDLPALLRTGGRVRVLVLDPTDDVLMTVADRHRSHGTGVEHLRRRILTTLEDLVMTRERAESDRLEIRVLSTIPSAGFNCLDVNRPNGVVCVQHYEFHPDGEATPIMTFSRKDAPWYEHFTAEAERLWTSGTKWPLDRDAR
jgi:hypothetical protein